MISCAIYWSLFNASGKDCRRSLDALPTGELVYFVAAVVVLFNPEQRTQRFYLGHTDQIKWYLLAKNSGRLAVE